MILLIYNSFDKSVIPQKIELMFNIYLMRLVSMASMYTTTM